MIVLNERYLKRILVEYLEQYHTSRTHQALNDNAPTRAGSLPNPWLVGSILAISAKLIKGIALLGLWSVFMLRKRLKTALSAESLTLQDNFESLPLVVLLRRLRLPQLLKHTRGGVFEWATLRATRHQKTA